MNFQVIFVVFAAVISTTVQEIIPDGSEKFKEFCWREAARIFSSQGSELIVDHKVNYKENTKTTFFETRSVNNSFCLGKSFRFLAVAPLGIVYRLKRRFLYSTPSTYSYKHSCTVKEYHSFFSGEDVERCKKHTINEDSVWFSETEDIHADFCTVMHDNFFYHSTRWTQSKIKIQELSVVSDVFWIPMQKMSLMIVENESVKMSKIVELSADDPPFEFLNFKISVEFPNPLEKYGFEGKKLVRDKHGIFWSVANEIGELSPAKLGDVQCSEEKEKGMCKYNKRLFSLNEHGMCEYNLFYLKSVKYFPYNEGDGGIFKFFEKNEEYFAFSNNDEKVKIIVTSPNEISIEELLSVGEKCRGEKFVSIYGTLDDVHHKYIAAEMIFDGKGEKQGFCVCDNGMRWTINTKLNTDKFFVHNFQADGNNGSNCQCECNREKYKIQLSVKVKDGDLDSLKATPALTTFEKIETIFSHSRSFDWIMKVIFSLANLSLFGVFLFFRKKIFVFLNIVLFLALIFIRDPLMHINWIVPFTEIILLLIWWQRGRIQIVEGTARFYDSERGETVEVMLNNERTTYSPPPSPPPSSPVPSSSTPSPSAPSIYPQVGDEIMRFPQGETIVRPQRPLLQYNRRLQQQKSNLRKKPVKKGKVSFSKFPESSKNSIGISRGDNGELRATVDGVLLHEFLKINRNKHNLAEFERDNNPEVRDIERHCGLTTTVDFPVGDRNRNMYE